MINRELIRSKIVQLTYAYYLNGGKNIDAAERELLLSLSKAYDLYNYLLYLMVALTQTERRRYEEGIERARQEHKDEPSQKFIANKFALQLEDNKMLQDFIADKGPMWDESPDFLRKLCDQIEQSEAYKEYMAAPESTYDEDRELWRKIYRQLIQNNPDLDALLEEKSIYWNDDKEVVDTFVLKTIKRFDPKNKSHQELLPEYRDAEDKEFATKLFRAAILNADEYQRYMRETSRHWDFSRLAYMDIVIMQIAIAEMLTFPAIPISVTINEYVDLAKIYSTPRSSGYINGMLDAIARHLADTGKLLKPVPPRPERPQQEHQGRQQERPVRQQERPRRNSDRSEGYTGPTRFVHRPRIARPGGEEPNAGAQPAEEPQAQPQSETPQPAQPDAETPQADPQA